MLSETNSYDTPDFGDMWIVAGTRRVARALRPHLGWAVLLLCAALAALPAWLLYENRWVRQTQSVTTLALAGGGAVIACWLLAGWGRAIPMRRYRAVATVALGLALLVLGALLLSVLLARWLPSWDAFAAGIRGGDWSPAGREVQVALQRLGIRYLLWWQGARAGAAPPDELVFVGFAGALLWIAGLAAAALARGMKQGLAAAMPPLLLAGGVAFIGGEGRTILVMGLAGALGLHVALNHQLLLERWQRHGLDYSPAIWPEFWLNAGGVAGAVLLVAAFAPNVSVSGIADRVARLLDPVDEQFETATQRVFPNIERRPVARTTAGEGGLPNDFLLGNTPELTQARILLVRTSESAPFGEAPEAHVLRGSTLATYTGLGWERLPGTEQRPIPGNTRLPAAPPADGRRPVAQSIRRLQAGRTIYTAPEPVEVGIAALAEVEDNGQLLALRSAEGAYTVISAVPALGEEALAALPAWDAESNPLPAGFERYLQLPDTVTERTRALAAELAAGRDSPWEVGRAIEDYLRTIPYDLDAPLPPEGVSDVADFFLFDLQRGYCDYYATAFAVLARLNGLPTRFALGYAPGSWDPGAQAWTITAADAHAWPEVYFPQVGWVRFEPTGYVALPVRRGAGDLAAASVSPTPPAAPDLPAPFAAFLWDWRTGAGLGALALSAAATVLAVRVRRERRRDPWLALLLWGERAGRPLQPGETALEYGAALAALAKSRAERTPDAARVVQREVAAFSAAVSRAHYAPARARPAAVEQAVGVWRRLRAYLPKIARSSPQP